MRADDQPFQAQQPPQGSDPWGAMLFGPREVEKLVDRLALALQEQTRLVRELDDSRAELAARQAEVEAARGRAERTNETLSTFLHALGHDLRAPFTAIGAGLELLAAEAHDRDVDTRADRLRSLSRTTAHGLALVDDLFELLRSEAGQWRVELGNHALADIAHDACALVATPARAKGLVLRIDWTDPALAATTLRTDATRLRQALVNLLGNAVKFSDAGEIVLRIEKADDGRQAWLVLSVLDNGPGFEPTEIAGIFEPFRQSSRTKRHACEGIGLGLAIVARCARLLGGGVAASNRPAGGACVALQIPLEPVAAAASSARLAQMAASGAGAAAPHVLIVDDAPESLRLAEHHFRRIGCRVTTATSLAEARAALLQARAPGATDPIELVVVDGELPDGHGSELLVDPRSVAGAGAGPPAPTAIPIVLSSARRDADHEAIDRGARTDRTEQGAGFAEILPKPLTREAVADLVASLFGTPRRTTPG